jgi:hypothetical protein
VKPRIFISYSSQETAATAVRDALAAALEASGSYTVLLDVITLEPGDRWRCRINLWLGACDAAVVLLSETALASPYVIYENSVLAYRREVHDPDLLILPVLLGEVTLEALAKSGLGPAQLEEHQFVRGTPAAIVARIMERLGRARFGDQTPSEKRARKIADLLGKITDEEVLREAAVQLALDLPWMSAGGDLRMRLAIQLMSVGMEAATKPLLHLRPQVAELERTGWVQKMIELVASSWVDLRCVGRIPSIAKGKTAVRAFSVNACQWDAARMYVVCASADDPEGTWYVASCTGIVGEDDSELAGEIRRALVQKLSSTDEDLVSDLEALNTSEQPVIVGLDRAGVTDEVLTRLRDREEFRHVCFFLLTGAQSEPGPPLSPAVVEMLFPGLLAGEETAFLDKYDHFRRSVRVR